MAVTTKEYPNFYENIKEATMRLQHTVVMYDGKPYYVLCITDDRPDGIFRVYMEPIGNPGGNVLNRVGGVPYDYPSPEKGKLMDEWMKKNPKEGVIRKMMNSPLFNKFRPFPLGMANVDGKCFYLERQPQRHTQQGLTQNMLYQSPVCLEPQKSRYNNLDITGPYFRDVVLGIYPSIEDCLKHLTDPEVLNDAVGFHRHFALVRGPIDTLFLAYKSDIVGYLPHGDTTSVRLSKKFVHTREAVAESGFFADIVVK